MNENIIENGMGFINDEKVIGKWEHFSIINSINYESIRRLDKRSVSGICLCCGGIVE